VPDDSQRDPQDQEHEGGQVLPGEWLRRLAHRRTREDRQAPPEGVNPAAAAPVPVPVDPGRVTGPAASAEDPGNGRRSGQGDLKGVEPTPADAVAASGDRARRQLEEQIARIRSGVNEATAAERSREPAAEPAAAQPPPGPAEPAPAVGQEAPATPDTMLERQPQAVQAAVEDRLTAITAQVAALEERLGALNAHVAALEEKTAHLTAQTHHGIDGALTEARGAATERELAEAMTRQAEEARKLVAAEAESARSSLSDDAGRLIQQLRAAEEWLKQERAAFRSPTGFDPEQLDPRLAQAIETIDAAVKSAEGRIAEQERKAAEVLSAKAQRRERVLAREEQGRTARRAREAIRDAERATRDAEERIARSVEQAIATLKQEIDKQRSKVAEAISGEEAKSEKGAAEKPEDGAADSPSGKSD
jgi:DNA repair exonuclease SbcCD ATPase subunit